MDVAVKACSLWIEATSQLAGQTFERAAHLVARSFVERCSRSDGAAGFTPSGLLPAEHELSDNRHRSIADRAHIMTLAARDSVIAPLDIAGDLGKLDPACIPDRRIAEIAGLFRDYVPDAGDLLPYGSR
jgi:hypothetical protein